MARQTIYTTREGDMIDLICFRHYRGDKPGAVAAVLDANFRVGLADYGPRLPRGLDIVLPDIEGDVMAESRARAALVSLWD